MCWQCPAIVAALARPFGATRDNLEPEVAPGRATFWRSHVPGYSVCPEPVSAIARAMRSRFGRHSVIHAGFGFTGITYSLRTRLKVLRIEIALIIGDLHALTNVAAGAECISDDGDPDCARLIARPLSFSKDPNRTRGLVC